MSSEVEALRAQLAQAESERDSALAIAAENARITHRINANPLDLAGNLREICAAASALAQGISGGLYFLDGEYLRVANNNHEWKDGVPYDLNSEVVALASDWPVARAAREGRAVQELDWLSVMRSSWRPANHEAFYTTMEMENIRTMVAVPMGTTPCLGVILVSRQEVRPFTAQQIATLEAFAAQAVTAVESARVLQALQQRTREAGTALELQTGIAEVLAIVAGNPEALDSVLPQLAATAGRLCDADSVTVIHGTGVRRRAWQSNGGFHFIEGLPSAQVHDRMPGGVAFLTNQPVRVAGGLDEVALSYPRLAEVMRQRGIATASWLAVPLQDKGKAVGAIVVSRNNSLPFSDQNLTTLETFAHQAVIAIENARLIGELRESNRQTNEALEVQRVMAHVLRIVAGAPADIEIALEEIGRAAHALTNCDMAHISVLVGDRQFIWNGPERVLPDGVPIGGITIMEQGGVSRLNTVSASVMRENRLISFDGLVSQLEKHYPDSASVYHRYGLEHVSFVFMPLSDVTGPIGVIGLVRPVPGPYTDAQLRILSTLADQAVVAIQNARLFHELETRNREITEALRREEASGVILRQISSAPEALDETLAAITDAARRLTGAEVTAVFGVDGDEAVSLAISRAAGGTLSGAGLIDIDPALLRTPIVGSFAKVRETRQAFVFNEGDREDFHDDAYQLRLKASGMVGRACVGIVRGDVLLGYIAIGNRSDQRVTPAVVSLLQSFADQAAIAIENARLIRELRESNREIRENLDTRRVMGEVLSIVASAPTDLNKTMPKIAEAAMALTQSDISGISWVEGDQGFIYLLTADGVVATDGIRQMPAGAPATLVSMARVEGRMIEFKGSIADYVEKWPFMTSIANTLGIREMASLAVPMFGPGGAAIGAVVITRREATDFSERAKTLLGALATQAVVAVENARLFKELQNKTEELEIASRHKSEFLANMSHELRTPLNAIIGYAELLQEECEDLGQQDFLPDLGKIHSAGKHLLILISGILDLSKVEAGRMTMFLEDFDVATLIKDADAIVRPLVEKNQNRFVIECPADIGTMHADLVKVRQVLFNLLSNSAKFTEGGTITLTVGKELSDDTIRFAIRDTGIGMTEEQLGRLFEAFSQANAETSRKYGGTGLGLALSREFCRMLGGDISVDSKVGKGSTFTVILPITCVEAENLP